MVSAVAKTTTRGHLHVGHALGIHIAGIYPNVKDGILEYFQNAIDAIDAGGNIVLELDKREKHREFKVYDNGIGISEKRMQEIVENVCNSQKKEDQYGRYAIGLFAMVGKCVEFDVVSAPKGTREYWRWTFNTKKIREGSSDFEIDKTWVGQQNVPWSTMVHIKNYTKDLRVSMIPSAAALFDEIATKFGAKMRANDVRIHIRVIGEDGVVDEKQGYAPQFSGKPLEQVTLNHRNHGIVSFSMALARRISKGYIGKITFGETGNPSRVSLEDFKKSHPVFSKETNEMLSSGVFEGEILSQKAKINPSRKGFIDNDALEWLVKATEEWCKKHGKAHYEKVREEREDERLQEVGLKSMRNIAPILKRFAAFFDVQPIKEGTVGNEHSTPASTTVLGKQKEKSKSIEGEKQEPDPDKETRTGSDERGGHDREGHRPFTVGGPRGRRRTLVKNDSIGLQLCHAALQDVDEPYIYEREVCRITINTLHPDWLKLGDDEDKWMQYQEPLMLMVCVKETFAPSVEVTTKRFTIDFLNLLAEHIGSRKKKN